MQRIEFDGDRPRALTVARSERLDGVKDQHGVGEVAAAENEHAGQISPVGTRQQPDEADEARILKNWMLAFADERDDRKRRQNPGDRGQPEDQVEAVAVAGAARHEAEDRQRPEGTSDRARGVGGLVEAEGAPPRGGGNGVRSRASHAAAISGPARPIRAREPEGSTATRR